jgi:DHA1 family bicyclomycin/chloramphenicol resistance-like MFS transporter
MSPTAHPATPARPRLASATVAVALALLLGLQPVTTDLYLPALPSLARSLAAPMSAVQLTMSALILAFGLAQLIWGPVADRIGRRPVLLLALGGFLVASIGAALAPGIGWLIAGRIAQGAMLAAAVVCARAMVRDLYEPAEGARVMSLGLSGLGLIAITSPLLGGVLAASGGWRAALAAVAAIGALTLLFVWSALPETIRQRDPQATRFAPLAANVRSVLRHPTFVAWAALTASTYGGLFTILAASPFVYIDLLGLTPMQFGLAMGTGSLSYIVGTVVCRRWLLRHGLAGAVRRGAFFTLAGGLSLLGLAALGVQAVWAVLLPQCLYAFGHGVHQPCGQTGAVGPFPHAAGVASAWAGFMLALVAFVVGLWLGRAIDGSVWPLALGVATWSVITATVAWTLVQRNG